MIVTEEEAKTKVCQETLGGVSSWSGGDYVHPARSARCAGSACMAWRWKRHDYTGAPTSHGYCGKAGRP